MGTSVFMVGVPQARLTVVVPPWPSLAWIFKGKKSGWLRAKLKDDDDPLLQAAIHGASLRIQETRRPEPLFIDPYAGCFLPQNVEKVMEQYPHPYCLATKFIDDKLLSTIDHIDGLKQVVLFTDGMDTRPYRLSWPTSTMIFDISPGSVFKIAAQKLEDVGAKLPKNCLLLHVPLESSDIQEILRRKGFQGNRPSIWVFQGLPGMTLAGFEELVSIVGSLAMKGCLFLGELPAWLAETEAGSKSSTKQWVDKLFMSNSFKVKTISYGDVARSLGKELESGEFENILLVAEQLRFSDDQMEIWRREFQRIEEDADEEGFEEL